MLIVERTQEDDVATASQELLLAPYLM